MTEKSHLSLKLTQLENAKQIPQNQAPKIQKIAHHLRDREHFAKNYFPRLVSIGPIHYGDEKLQLGEQYKLMWTKMYLERTQQNARTLYQKIVSEINQLKVLFAEDVIGNIDDDELSWMLFVDGCSLLQILDKGKLNSPQEMNVKVDQLVLVWQDVLLLENQLPYNVLKLLSGHNGDTGLLKSMKEFLKCHHLSPVRPDQGARKQEMSKVKKAKDEDSVAAEEGYSSVDIDNEVTLQQEHGMEMGQQESPPVHLLDQLRRTIVDPPGNHQDPKKDTTTRNCWIFNRKKIREQTIEEKDMITHRNIQELKASGIRLKTSKSRRLKDISFSCGWWLAELKLPEIVVDDTTATSLLNLIAYELCPDFKNNYEISSFVTFIDSLVDHPDDVKELRSAEILQNALGSDKKVAKLFNTISTDLVPDTQQYSDVTDQIEKHYRNKCKTWIAIGCHTYFGNPWSIIAFHAAALVLVLTFIQTFFAVKAA